MKVFNEALNEILVAPNFVLAIQLQFAVLATLFFSGGKLTIARLQMLKWSFAALLYCGVQLSLAFSYKHLAFSKLALILSPSPIVTLLIEKCVMPIDKRPAVSLAVVVALCTLPLGWLLFSDNIVFSLVGLAVALLHMVLSITNHVVQRRFLTTECNSLSIEVCVVLNNVIAVVPAARFGMMMGEFTKFDGTLWFGSIPTFLLLLGSCICCAGMCYVTIAMQREVSATSLMVLQNASRMGLVAAGIVLCHEPLASARQAVGLTLSFAGTLCYARTQLNVSDSEPQKTAMATKDKETDAMLRVFECA
eukprot:CAMPEP_0117620796 /NCGR_PEP_ID=MMETSP0784-20121206/87311_1 /TAXON_ID=39447 /ORGANISM="" /LENGTH=305 /DNA_ID=CAMNT_0005424717 /DNA_START=173 /DNA_END=1086 /DNA_ORIENTATION=+